MALNGKKHAFLSGDLVAASLVTLQILLLFPRSSDIEFAEALLLSMLTAVVFIGVTQLFSGYRVSQFQKLDYNIASLIKSSAGLIVLYSVLCIVIPSIRVEASWILGWWAELLLVTLLFRLLIFRFFLRERIEIRTLILGAGQAGKGIAELLLAHPEHRFSPIGFINDSDKPSPLQGVRILGKFSEIREIARASNPQIAVMAIMVDRRSHIIRAAYELERMGIGVVEMPELYEQVGERVPVEHLGDQRSGFEPGFGEKDHPVYNRLNGMFNRVAAAALLILLSPLFVALAIFIRLNSGGPVLYMQDRTGHLNGKFRCIKFRSMVEEAEEQSGPVWAEEEDPRVTPAGRFMRRLRLDELPQLFNVLKGDMNLVGPRPERPEFVDWLASEIPFYNQRHLVKSGISGWAQINHSYGNTLEDALVKLQYDLYYIKNRSFAFDFAILLRTIAVVAARRGT